MVNDYFAIDITGFVMENHPFCDDKEGRQHSLLPPLGCSPAKTDGAVNGGRSPFILTGEWLGRLCYLHLTTYFKMNIMRNSFNFNTS